MRKRAVSNEKLGRSWEGSYLAMVFLTSVFRGIGSHSRIISTIESQAILANKGEGGRGGITKERKGKGEGNKVKKKRGGGRGATERGGYPLHKMCFA